MSDPAPTETETARPARPRRNLYDQAYILLLFPPLFWAGNFVLGRAMAAEVPPIGLAFWRWTIAFLILLPFAWRHVRRDWPEIRRAWRVVLVLSFAGVAVFNTLIYTGLQTTTALNALLMQSAMPVVIVVMSFAFFRERIRGIQGLGIACSLLGAVIIILRGDPQVLLGLALTEGDLWIALAVMFYAAYSALLRLRPAIHWLSFLAVTFGPASLMLLPLYLWESIAFMPMDTTPDSLLTIAYVAVFPSILAYICFNRGVELIGANRAGLFFHLIPAFGAVMAVAMLGETLRLYHALGFALILGGILLATRNPVAQPLK